MISLHISIPYRQNRPALLATALIQIALLPAEIYCEPKIVPYLLVLYKCSIFCLLPVLDTNINTHTRFN